jgi:hypothetical protein
MAQGDITLFEEFKRDLGLGIHNLNTDAHKLYLTSGTPTAADINPSYADWTEVSGTNYTAGGLTVNLTYTEAAGTGTLATDGATYSWLQDAAGPTGINFGVIYNDTSVGNEAICFIDFRAGGTTAISLQDGDITWTAEAVSDRIFTLT